MKHIVTVSLWLTLAYSSSTMAQDYNGIVNKTSQRGGAVLECVTNSTDSCVVNVTTTATGELMAKQMTPLIGKALPAVSGVYECAKDTSLENCGKAAGKVAVSIGVGTAAVPTAVATAGALGATASTGTAIASLSGAAATSATLAAVGTPVAATVTAVTGVVAAPALVGAVVVGGVAVGVAAAINWLFF